jgi:FMN hydrolase / 5-amino-6-(5-phospho-D-ribitylamino)uracil phosphatase
MIRAVIFDVDFTLFQPGPALGPEGYRDLGREHGLDLDPARYETARLGAIEEVQQHPELVHDEEVWILFTEEVMVRMGGEPGACRACATEMVRRWEQHHHFTLYDDATEALAEMRRRGLRIGLISNGQRDLVEFAQHHGLDVDVACGSLAHGRIKPHPSIFEAALEALGVDAEETVMVGDSYRDDIEGARALGMRAILVDRDGLHPNEPDRIETLSALPAALGFTA